MSIGLIEQGLNRILPDIRIDNVRLIQDVNDFKIKIRYHLETNMDLRVVSKWVEDYVKIRIVREDSASGISDLKDNSLGSVHPFASFMKCENVAAGIAGSTCFLQSFKEGKQTINPNNKLLRRDVFHFEVEDSYPPLLPQQLAYFLKVYFDFDRLEKDYDLGALDVKPESNGKSIFLSLIANGQINPLIRMHEIVLPLDLNKDGVPDSLTSPSTFWYGPWQNKSWGATGTALRLTLGTHSKLTAGDASVGVLPLNQQWVRLTTRFQALQTAEKIAADKAAAAAAKAAAAAAKAAADAKKVLDAEKAEAARAQAAALAAAAKAKTEADRKKAEQDAKDAADKQKRLDEAFLKQRQARDAEKRKQQDKARDAEKRKQQEQQNAKHSVHIPGSPSSPAQILFDLNWLDIISENISVPGLLVANPRLSNFFKIIDFKVFRERLKSKVDKTLFDPSSSREEVISASEVNLGDPIFEDNGNAILREYVTDLNIPYIRQYVLYDRDIDMEVTGVYQYSFEIEIENTVVDLLKSNLTNLSIHKADFTNYSMIASQIRDMVNPESDFSQFPPTWPSDNNLGGVEPWIDTVLVYGDSLSLLGEAGDDIIDKSDNYYKMINPKTGDYQGLALFEKELDRVISKLQETLTALGSGVKGDKG